MEKKASSFSGQIGFVLAAAGSAVGVGNLWRFPYLAAKDGGGLFLLVYLVLVLTFGFTLLTSDIAIGRRTKQSAIRAYETMRPKWKFLGILTFLVPVLIMTYYAVIGGWITKYAAVYLTGQSAAAAEDGYFTSFITSPVSPVVFALLFMGVTAFIVYNGVEGGIERVSRYMMPILLVLAFFIVGIAKGSVLNTCTILVSGNSADRTRGMNTMHACYACGALLCPFLISAAARVSTTLAVLALAALGLVLWLVYLFTPMAGRAKAKEAVTDWSFLRSSRFWLLTGLLFCQNAAEQSVVGWMVTYFKDSGIIAGTLAAYTVTVMWGATLIGRLLIAFVFPLKQPRKAMVFMAFFCTAFYFAIMQTHSQLPAILLLFAFAFSMAGMNPTAVASAGGIQRRDPDALGHRQGS